MIVKAIFCEECNTTVYSRGHGDMRECECGRVVVYGGFLNYFKYDIKDKKTRYEVRKININATPDDLYRDFESMSDNFGLLKPVDEDSKNQKSFIF